MADAAARRLTIVPPATPVGASARPVAAPVELGTTARRGVSLRVLMPATAAALITAALVGAAMISERNARELLVRELETRLVLEARNLALTSSPALLEDFPELMLQPIVRDLIAGRRELEFAAVLDHNGVIRGHPHARDVGRPWDELTDMAPMTSQAPLRADERVVGNARSMAAMAPVQHAAGKRLGTAIVVMRRSYLDGAIAESRSRMWALFAGVIAAGALVTLLFMRRMLQPVAALRAGLERIGRGDLGTKIRIQDRTELGMLADTVNTMSAALERARRESIEKERLASELELARRIQESLLPLRSLARGGFEMAGSHRAAAEVGGDYYDRLELPDGRVGLAIADVSGKGLAGCMVMSMLSALLHALRDAHASPSALLIALEAQMVRTLGRGSFVTMWYGVLDPATGHLIFASAGHLPTVVWRARTRTTQMLRSRGVPIGAVRGGALRASLQDETLTLEPGDLLLQLTDGYHEAMNEHGESFGFGRVEQVVRDHAANGAAAVLAGLSSAALAWTGPGEARDDQTALVACHTAAAPAPVAATASARVSASREPASPASRTAALALLARAGREGYHLSLGAELSELTRLRSFLQECPDVRELPAPAGRLLESALYEACANIIEHGYAGRPEARFDVWWVPERGSRDHAGADDVLARVRCGRFVLRERGRRWDPTRHAGVDLNDPHTRRRGRGLGIEMIRRIMRGLEYVPDTPEGNLTVLHFDPDDAAGPIDGGGE